MVKQIEFNTRQTVALMLALVLLGFAFGLIFCAKSASACEPCASEEEQKPICGYVQSVDPVTGKLERNYVCE